MPFRITRLPDKSHLNAVILIMRFLEGINQLGKERIDHFDSQKIFSNACRKS